MTRRVNCGGVAIGGGAPISVQSMTNTDTRDAEATVAQIMALSKAGCDIVRCAVPDKAAAAALYAIKSRVDVPIVADIHFDHRLAIAAMENGADKIRINPGNIGGDAEVRAVVRRARTGGIPIRVGVNSGSLEADLLDRFGGPTPRALAESAVRNIERLRRMDFEDIVVSIKSSDVRETRDALNILVDRTDCPLHIGITEAGIGTRAVIKSAVGVGALLLDGVGDTVRVSLTGDPLQEVTAARDLLACLNLLPGAVNIISCPTCGRCRTDLARIAAEVSEAIGPMERTRRRDRIEGALTVAIMGCAVNGPGEAAHADLGVACGDGRAALFRKGAVIGAVAEGEIVPALLREIAALSAETAKPSE
ncbi:MAG: flavodoxin-dependent (E)-4-hydroxy-3-methylbut-2-enyl-diphosphate synthase [Clostridiales Family XIII bacterium]|jgi:(E)-4-hydroxy-3-methylbut-2-enyl-diphosphate synthase|nr:flavodoxin-dependent (E)-4-hydroxy-3-methylbut-2-enyl-diphosphate synthase [Clostridiales Family XIII bacterium]